MQVRVLRFQETANFNDLNTRITVAASTVMQGDDFVVVGCNHRTPRASTFGVARILGIEACCTLDHAAPSLISVNNADLLVVPGTMLWNVDFLIHNSFAVV